MMDSSPFKNYSTIHIFLVPVNNGLVLDKLEPQQGGWYVHRKGENFVRGQHASGTEIKAITYSAMQITEKDNDAEVFVIVDI